MMIEHIRFRAWNTLNKSWNNPAILRVSNEGFLYYQRDGKHIVSRFSGLKDSEGNDLYEGDIVSCWLPSMTGNMRARQCVTFYKGFFGFGDYPLYLVDISRLKLIGNIFENPELMDGKNEKKQAQPCRDV